MDAKAEKQLRYLLDKHLAASGVYDDVEFIDDVDAFVDALPAVVPGSYAERPSEGYLAIHVTGCTSLLEPPGSRLVCSIAFNGRRYESELARSDGTAVKFDAQFVYPLPAAAAAKAGRDGDASTTRVLATPGGLPPEAHAVLVRVDSYGLRTVVGEGDVEWRGALARQKVTAQTELRCAAFPLAVGGLESTCEYVPVHGAGGLLSEEGGREMMQAVAHDVERRHAAAHLLANRVKEWRRGVPTGRNVAVDALHNSRLHLVTAFVAPLSSQDVFDTPYHAAHFATLLRMRDDPATDDVTGAVLADEWTSFHSVFAAGACRLNERAALLCSLLLGFGLDAWVACGADPHGAFTYWVLTKEGDGIAPEDVLFWDPLSGRRERWGGEGDSISRDHTPFAHGEIHSVFNHTGIYVNLQEVGGSAPPWSFAFEAPERWRAFDTEGVVTASQAELALAPPSPHPSVEALEAAFEQEVVLGVLEYRSGIGLAGLVTAAGDLYPILGQALWQYATEQLTGRPTGADGLFLAACQQFVPPRHSLKAFPTHFAHTHASYVLAHLLQCTATKDLLETRQHNTTITVRARITRYPEGLVSVWLILAAVHSNL
eukprot:TRINITY_DN20878_c0_g1_i1.p1 TRINITY_DN20878_c0_g1~~TRINITY_DN20878_c0_g1_i1.p1  ORF type:complete len:624 (+),score=167.66 TRINITY_DN20878_c0_g1_i1:77-1873(+)